MFHPQRTIHDSIILRTPGIVVTWNATRFSDSIMDFKGFEKGASATAAGIVGKPEDPSALCVATFVGVLSRLSRSRGKPANENF